MNTRHLRAMPAKGGRVRSSLPGSDVRTQTELDLLVREKERMARVRSNWVEYQKRTEAEMAAVTERIERLRARLRRQLPPRAAPTRIAEDQRAEESRGGTPRSIDLEY